MRGSRTLVNYKDVSWHRLWDLLPYLLEFRGRIAAAVLCLVGAKVASIGLPFILKYIVDDLDNNSGAQLSSADVLIVFPLGLLIAYGAVRFSSVIFGEIRDTLFGRVTERAMRRIGLTAFQHLHSLDLEFHLNRRTGGLSRDIERGITGISFLMRFMVFNIVPTLLEIGMVAIILALNYSWVFAAIVLGAVLVYVTFSVLATEVRTRFVRAMNTAESNTSTRAVDSLMNYETVKYFGNEAREAENYDTDLANWERARQKNRLSLFALNGGQAFIISASMTLAMILAAYYVTQGVMTLGDFVLINAFMMQIFLPLNFLGFVYREMKGSMANIEKLFELMDKKPRIIDAPDAKPLEISKGAITFNQVTFHYHADRTILQGVAFYVPPKQKVAIVGSSGSGKSTLFKLLFRFYDVTQGSICIDGQDIRKVTQSSLRAAIGVVPQDTVLFNQSIFENIRYGRMDATDEEVEQAIRLAHLDDFITKLSNGRDTLVGERGLKLSGGEKQRVAIARALLKKPPIMVFDEATSSLDTHSEQSILAAIEEISRFQTTLVIAHRLSTVVNADRILVLDDGKIIEQGDHQYLLTQKGKYAQLWETQQAEAI